VQGLRIILGIICAGMVIGALLVAFHWTTTYNLPIAGTLLLNCLPILLGLLFGILMVVRRPPHAGFYVTALKVCMGFTFLYGLSTSGLELYYSSVLPTRDVRLYESRYGSLWKYDLAAVDHFPAKIPANASRVLFFALPRVGQRSPIMQLRYIVDANTLASLASTFSRQQVTPGKGDTLPLLIAGEATPIPMPADFTLYYLPKTHSAAKPGVTYTQQRGVAISTTRSEVIFWAQELQKQTKRVQRGLPTYDR
jgi:hypothetical protein